ncbi:purine-nucleoside phosphorylase [Leucobacter sp. wl10]|uniref:phosphorylase family protein n=1 Tax=Leucobacter sp. wl10 TaxID=2304677 RepID=UPI000E5A100C|nr:purine-nucleoside phosphorylase [Leucobacter sp. wl10]RGE23336.1 purine-nucleoside phosphorylase [Leucobacter sp. wl10]
MTEPRTLLVFAHRDEASAFADVPHLVTGVGKVNAAVSLADALAAGDFGRVVVLGTAGVVSDGEERPHLDEVYQIVGVVQHDFSLPSPELRPRGEAILPPESTAVLATGDAFVRDDAQRARIAGLGTSLVDMEAYAYASVCERFDVPLQLFKIPSDFADSSTTDEEWDAIVFRKSEQLREFWRARLDRAEPGPPGPPRPPEGDRA